ncbi:NADPH:quinone oxidoreductase family protein [Amycolatopsis alkalitolerans]|uniref:NADPH:quinone oxidoreductase family protein n=1 Tax=Amycolatopsis alkalitolerans TaxID=2547244 RepID=A0A5C4M0M1_9PSEU|nr:NADPH:quinone oxidoreductase family protein [Amycolatopsis alkalitolerans]TNC25163.1 NADPH:quinone oxidoreductase family protein [Amycolatopsis alkalitolerans]
MRAYLLESFSGPSGLRLSERDTPERVADRLLVRIGAIGINFPDLLLTRGEYQYKPPLPVVPGCELAGYVLAAPEGSGFTPGDAVAGFVWSGSYAEVAAVPVTSMAHLPDGMPLDVAAATVVNYHTVHFGLIERAGLLAGEQVLVLGAAGGIGTAAVQVAAGLGARVIAGVADDRQSEVARRAGAHATVRLDEGFAKAVRSESGGGVDLVADPLGDWLFLEGLRSLRPRGRLVTIGFAAGKIPEVKVNRLLLNNIAVIGAAWGAALDLDPGLLARGSAAITGLWRDGGVNPVIGARYGFEQVPQALDDLAHGRIPGKGVVTVGQPPAGRDGVRTR